MAIQGFGKASLKDITAFESNNEIKLPGDYIDFLLKYNGGVVEPSDQNSVYVEGIGEKVNIDVLFGMNTQEAELSIELWLNDYRRDMPQGTVILGTSYQHGFIILLCSDEEAGIYYWDHTYEFACSSDDSNTYFIADTFADFSKGLL